MRKKLEALIEDVAQLVSLPEVYHQLEDAIARPRSSLDDLARIIAADPDLCARLLSMANSAFYGFPAKIESIHRALATVGTRQLRDLALATVAVRLFTQLPLNTVTMTSFWRHSLYCGVLARAIARHLDEPNVERFYVAGLLHDVGRLLLYLKLPDLMHQLLVRCATEKRLLVELEREHIGFDHAEAGAALLGSWRLPQALCEPVRWHHVPAGAGTYELETCVVHLANALTSQKAVGTSGDGLVAPLDPLARERVGLDEAGAARLAEEAEAQFDAVAGLFLPG